MSIIDPESARTQVLNHMRPGVASLADSENWNPPLRKLVIEYVSALTATTMSAGDGSIPHGLENQHVISQIQEIFRTACREIGIDDGVLAGQHQKWYGDEAKTARQIKAKPRDRRSKVVKRKSTPSKFTCGPTQTVHVEGGLSDAVRAELAAEVADLSRKSHWTNDAHKHLVAEFVKRIARGQRTAPSNLPTHSRMLICEIAIRMCVKHGISYELVDARLKPFSVVQAA